MKKSAGLYDTDFFCWTAENAALLRQRKFDDMDLEHIAEEIEDMGKRDRREVRSRLIVLIAHLLKWQVQPKRRTQSWRNTISRERRRLPLIFLDSPSLERYAQDDLALVYPRAVEAAADGTGVPPASMPQTCPYTLEQVLDRGFLPE